MRRFLGVFTVSLLAASLFWSAASPEYAVGTRAGAPALRGSTTTVTDLSSLSPDTAEAVGELRARLGISPAAPEPASPAHPAQGPEIMPTEPHIGAVIPDMTSIAGKTTQRFGPGGASPADVSRTVVSGPATRASTGTKNACETLDATVDNGSAADGAGLARAGASTGADTPRIESAGGAASRRSGVDRSNYVDAIPPALTKVDLSTHIAADPLGRNNNGQSALEALFWAAL